MRVLILSPYPELIERPIRETGDAVIAVHAAPAEVDFSADMIVSFGYRHILKETILKSLGCPAFNIHISFLPWNRGADPNFWSWFDRTPKGVSIHQIDSGIDTGSLVAQASVGFGDPSVQTLATTYNKLREAAVALFASAWPRVRAGELNPVPQQGAGSYHRTKDKARWWQMLPSGYETKVSVIEEMGRNFQVTEC